MKKEELMSLTDEQLQEALYTALADFDDWSSSDDGSDGACWDYRVRPVLEEAKRRGIELRRKREKPLYVLFRDPADRRWVVREVSKGGIVGHETFATKRGLFGVELISAYSEDIADLFGAVVVIDGKTGRHAIWQCHYSEIPQEVSPDAVPTTYGAIWTCDGLIYVAKMEDGRFVPLK